MKKKSTPQLLADALLVLAEKKDIDKIKIKEIVGYCGLSSQTFYNHFSDKYELILWVHKSVGEELLNKLEKGDYSFRDMTIDNLRFYSDHATFMLNALTNTHGQDSYARKSHGTAVEELSKFIKKKNNLKELSEKEMQHLRMFCYASVGIFADWANDGRQIPIETMADYILDALPESLRKYLL